MVRSGSLYKVTGSSQRLKNVENEQLSTLMSEISINFKEIRRSPNVFWKCVWITAFLSLTALCGYQVFNVSQRYFKYQTTTQFRKIQPDTITLPNLHLCYENWVSKKAQTYFDRVKHGNYVMDYFQDFRKPGYNVTALNLRSALYHKQDGALSPEQFWSQYQKKISNNIKSCHISFMDLRDCGERMAESIYYSGLLGPYSCYIVSPQNVANQTREGLYGSFQFLLENRYKLDAGECDPNLADETCVWFVHISFPSSHTRKETFKLKAGYWLQIQLTEVRNTFLGDPYGAPCHTNGRDPYYSRNECISDRLVSYYNSLLNCTPFGYKEIVLNHTIQKNISWCQPGQVVEFEKRLKDEDVMVQLNKYVNGEYVQCQKPCKDISFTIYTEYSRLSESEPKTSNVSKGMSKISLYHKALEVEEWSERPSTTFTDLVIEVGAILTFWLGIRFMNMLQIAYFIFLALKRKLLPSPTVANIETQPVNNNYNQNFSLAKL